MGEGEKKKRNLSHPVSTLAFRDERSFRAITSFTCKSVGLFTTMNISAGFLNWHLYNARAIQIRIISLMGDLFIYLTSMIDTVSKALGNTIQEDISLKTNTVNLMVALEERTGVITVRGSYPLGTMNAQNPSTSSWDISVWKCNFLAWIKDI